MRPLHLLTGEYPPHAGGVGDYTHMLAHALAARGCDVHVWCPTVSDAAHGDVQVHRLPDAFGRSSMRALERQIAVRPVRLLLQYVPNALGRRGANVAFCAWLERARARGADVRVMFHEPYFYFSFSPARNALALVQRYMAWHLLAASSRVYVSTETWTRYLQRWASRDTPFAVLPIPSTIPALAAAGDVARWRAAFAAAPRTAHVVGHFGTFGEHVARELRRMVPAVLGASPFTTFACIGRNGTAFAASLGAAAPGLRHRIVATGAIDAADAAAAIQACDVMLQPYPDGVTTRRTSVMAPLACGVATLTTDGPLSEPVWRDSTAVALVAPSDGAAASAAVARLLGDEPSRRALGSAGRLLYDTHFALERTVERLLKELRPAA